MDLIRTKMMRTAYQNRALVSSCLLSLLTTLLGCIWWLSTLDTHVLPSAWLVPCFWVGGFLLVAIFYTLFRKLHEKVTHIVGWWIFNAICIWLGAYIAQRPETTRFGELEVPQMLAAPFYIILCLAMGKVLVSIVSLPLVQGLLPDALRTLDTGAQRQEQILTDVWRSEARFAQALIEVQREESRHVLRQFRIQYEDDHDFAYHGLMSMIGALYYKFEDHADMFFTSVEDIFDPMYDPLDPRAYALTLKAASGEEDLYFADLELGVCAVAYRLEALSSAYVVTTYFHDKIISPSEYEHFWQVCLAMFDDPTINNRELAIYYHAYVQSVLS